MQVSWLINKYMYKSDNFASGLATIFRYLVSGRSWASFFTLDDKHKSYRITLQHHRMGFALAGVGIGDIFCRTAETTES
jgi:hypothetical protein